MRNALALAALVATLSCSRERPVEARAQPVASVAAPQPTGAPAESASAVATPSGSASAMAAPVVASTEARESLEHMRKRLAVPCGPLPAKRPADFSVLYEVYTQPREGGHHVYRRIGPEGAACRDDEGPALYYDDLALQCVQGNGAVMDKLYAEIRGRWFTAMRQSTDEMHGPRHHASRVVVGYQGKRCERMDTFGIPIERISWERYMGLFDVFKKAIEDIRSGPVEL